MGNEEKSRMRQVYLSTFLIVFLLLRIRYVDDPQSDFQLEYSEFADLRLWKGNEYNDSANSGIDDSTREAKKVLREREIFLKATLQLLDEKDNPPREHVQHNSFSIRKKSGVLGVKEKFTKASGGDSHMLDVIRYGMLKKASRGGALQMTGGAIQWKVKYVELRHGIFVYDDNVGEAIGTPVAAASKPGFMQGGTHGWSFVDLNSNQRTIQLLSDKCVCRAVKLRGGAPNNCAFEISMINGPRRLWMASSAEECSEWIHAIQSAMIGGTDGSVPLGDAVGHTVSMDTEHLPISGSEGGGLRKLNLEGHDSHASLHHHSSTGEKKHGHQHTTGAFPGEYSSSESDTDDSSGKIRALFDAVVAHSGHSASKHTPSQYGHHHSKQHTPYQKNSSSDGAVAPYANEIARYINLQNTICSLAEETSYKQFLDKLVSLHTEISVPVFYIKNKTKDANFALSPQDSLSLGKQSMSVCRTQVWKDLQRDVIRVDGEIVSGENGPEAIVGVLVRHIADAADRIRAYLAQHTSMQRLDTIEEHTSHAAGHARANAATKRTMHGPGSIASFDLTEAQMVACARDLLVLCNRTQSGGDTYFTVDSLLCDRSAGLCILTPHACDVEPLLVKVDVISIRHKMKKSRSKSFSGWNPATGLADSLRTPEANGKPFESDFYTKLKHANSIGISDLSPDHSPVGLPSRKHQVSLVGDDSSSPHGPHASLTLTIPPGPHQGVPSSDSFSPRDQFSSAPRPRSMGKKMKSIDDSILSTSPLGHVSISRNSLGYGDNRPPTHRKSITLQSPEVPYNIQRDYSKRLESMSDMASPTVISNYYNMPPPPRSRRKPQLDLRPILEEQSSSNSTSNNNSQNLLLTATLSSEEKPAGSISTVSKDQPSPHGSLRTAPYSALASSSGGTQEDQTFVSSFDLSRPHFNSAASSKTNSHNNRKDDISVISELTLETHLRGLSQIEEQDSSVCAVNGDSGSNVNDDELNTPSHAPCSTEKAHKPKSLFQMISSKFKSHHHHHRHHNREEATTPQRNAQSAGSDNEQPRRNSDTNAFQARTRDMEHGHKAAMRALQSPSGEFQSNPNLSVSASYPPNNYSPGHVGEFQPRIGGGGASSSTTHLTPSQHTNSFINSLHAPHHHSVEKDFGDSGHGHSSSLCIRIDVTAVSHYRICSTNPQGDERLDTWAEVSGKFQQSFYIKSHCHGRLAMSERMVTVRINGNSAVQGFDNSQGQQS